MSLEAENPYTFRPYVPDDLNFIQSSWGHSYYKGANFDRILAPKPFHDHHRPIRERILAKPSTAIIVACAKDAHDVILGYIIVEDPPKPPNGFNGMILHYLYVKEAFKKEGIATELLAKSIPSTPVFYTHETELIRRILKDLRIKDHANGKLDRFKDYYFEPHLI